MNDAIITFDPANIIPADNTPTARPAYTAVIWFIMLAAAVAAFIGNIYFRVHLLPTAPVHMVKQYLIMGFFLHCAGCYLAGGSIAVAPKARAALGLSVLVLAINLLFVLGLIFTGPATITYIR